MPFDYFEIEELRALPHMADTGKYPDESCEIAAEYIVGRIESEVGTSFVPRERTYVAPSSGRIALPDYHVLELLTLGDESEDLPRVRAGIIAGEYAEGTIVTYRAGYSHEPPPDIKGAALAGTRLRLLATHSKAPNDGRQTSLSNESGTYQLAVAGPDRPTGYPDVDAVITRWRDRLRPVGMP